MKKYTVALVTADSLVEKSIGNLLDELGYHQLPTASSYADALEIVLKNNPDIVIISSSLSGHKTGDDLAEWLKEKHPIPFLFINKNKSGNSFDILQMNNQLYEVTPDQLKSQFHTAIIKAVQIFHTTAEGISGNKKIVRQYNNFCFLKEGNTYYRVEYRHIYYIESRENYLKIISEGRNTLVVRATMKEFEELLAEENFIRISRSHIVQMNHIEKLNATHVTVHGQLLPLGKTYKEAVFNRLGLREAGISVKQNDIR